ncbi:leucine rich repeat [Chlorella sorokiniana]|uniref:Leucine rich repeat n=1 Tax=Chlorella sorokiniana TaxID=3076 RepID=A0A2P6TJ45_CHLSO|nr:leucine rich repeat [Chlorella sorokiniana]|eukprot:PRW39268.1 leucine rich repeat [Chlorella sorokiniana]
MCSDSFELGSVPASLVQCRHLEELMLQSQGLTDLPRGPYLTGLRELSLHANRFTSLPLALSTATALQELDINCDGLAPLSDDDLDLLSCLPHL